MLWLYIAVGLGVAALAYLVISETESGDDGATDVLCAFGLGRSAGAAAKSDHQLRVIFSFQSYPPARTGSRLTEQARF